MPPLRRHPHSAEVEPECPRCGYLGWAHTDDLTEPIRKLLRKRPPEVRRLHVAQ
jgi:hypothetical protein